MSHLDSVTFLADTYPTREVYPFSLKPLQVTPSLDFSSPVTIFVGENGSGKSTVLKAIARACGIHIWTGIERERVGWNPHEDRLHRHLRVSWSKGPVHGAFFASENFRNFAELVDEWASTDPGLFAYFGGKSLITQSHGQSHLAFFRSRFGIEGLYLLDEPETALSPRSQMQFLEILRDTSAAGVAQFVIATHSPILLSVPGATIYSFDTVPIGKVACERTAHYQAYAEFFERRRVTAPRGRD